MKRTHSCGELTKKEAGKRVVLAGWVETIRLQGKIGFLLLRDSAGITQVFLNSELSKKFGTIAKESVIFVEGEVKKRPDNQINKEMVTGEIEVVATKIEIINEAETPLPIDIEEETTTHIDKRLDYRFLDFHRKKTQAVFKIQTEIANSFREFFYKKGYIEMQPPCVISAASEGGTDLFPVQYFEKKGYLAQSPQLYKEMLACSMEKTFMITPIWRAEKHNTPRHINEIRQMDIEVAFADQMEIMKIQEECIKCMIQSILDKCKEELKLLNVKSLKVPKGVYLSYEEAIKKVSGKIGEDFTPEQEKRLCEMYPNSVIFTHSWPSALKPFYIMPKGEDAKAKFSEGFDSVYGGMEISSGGQRIHLPDLLIKRLKEKKLNPENFKFFVDSFRYGAAFHSGWSIGLERFTQVVCGLDNVKEATMFPRDRDRLTP